MADIDPILALQTLGYTEREASFLYLVATYSGYFLRRQFDYFIDRNKGAIAHHFLEKARAFGHARALDYGQRWNVYHLFAKPIYRLLGNAESQHRRAKGDAQIKAKLMALDYVFENESDHFLATEDDRREFFEVTRGLPVNMFGGHAAGELPFTSLFPVSLADRTDPQRSLVRFTFIDEGQLSTAKFLRFVTSMKPAFHALGKVELVYVADSELNFTAIERIFARHFRPIVPPEQRQLQAEWRTKHGHSQSPAMSEPPELTTLLFHYSYPRLHRYVPRGSKEGSHAGSNGEAGRYGK